MHEFISDEEAIDKIIELESDKYKYLEMLSEPWFNNNEINEYINRRNIKQFFDKIFSEEVRLVSSWFLSKGYKFKYKAVDFYYNLIN